MSTNDEQQPRAITNQQGMSNVAHSTIGTIQNYFTAARQLGPMAVPPEELADARMLLESMPLHLVPHPIPLPNGSRMAFDPNPHFVGREQALLDLARALRTRQHAAITPTAAMTGMGGIGKTQLDVEFAYRSTHSASSSPERI